MLQGQASLPINPGPGVLKFRENKDAKARKILSDSIRTVIYYLSGKTVEYDVRDVYVTPSHKMVAQLFLEVLKRGYVTLYTYSGMENFIGVGSMTNVINTYFACWRDGEPVATMISGTEKKGRRDFFELQASAYFKGDPEIVARVKDKTYHWDDMEKLVDDYNGRRK